MVAEQDPAGVVGGGRPVAAPTAVSSLIDAARHGLASVGGEVDWVGRFDSGLAKLGVEPGEMEVRVLAAGLLRDAVDAWFAEEANRASEWGWAVGVHSSLRGTLSEQDLSGAVIVRLKATAGFFERAEGAWDPRRWEGGGEEKWFPVRDRGFAVWVRDSTAKEAGEIAERASKTPIPTAAGQDGELLTGGPVRPGTLRPPDEGAVWGGAVWGGASFDKVRAVVGRVAVSDLRVLSPDLVGRTGDGRVKTEQLVRFAALGAAGAVFDFLEGETGRLKDVEKLCADAVREADPGEARPTRAVPDVAFALAEALRLAAQEIGTEPSVSEEIKAATTAAFVQWRFAQLPMVAKSLFEALTADPNDGRRRGRGRWAMGLCADLVELRAKRSPLVPFVSDQARAALDWLAGEVTLGGGRVVRRRVAEVAAGVAVGDAGLAGFGEGVRGEVAVTLLGFERSLNEFITMAAPGLRVRQQEDR